MFRVRSVQPWLVTSSSKVHSNQVESI